jgi:hypothetical protein
VTVVVEVKGSWHPELMSAMGDQLVGQYLSPTHPEGIYLAVWFDTEHWADEGDSRRTRSGRRDPKAVIEELTDQSAEFGEEGYKVVPYLLDASLR